MAAKKNEPVKNKGNASPQPAAKKAKLPKAKEPSPFILRALWVVILILLFIPIIKQLSQKQHPEESVATASVKNDFTLDKWFGSTYQKQAEEDLKQTWSFKTALTQFNNDLDYELFHKCNVNGFVLGKDDYICSEGYIEGYLGRDYLGEDSITRKLKVAKALQDTLKKRGIDLVFVYAPDKATYFPEYLASKYEQPRGKTNFDDFVHISQKLGINYIDMESWFLSMKPTTPYPLFPQYGHHWSYYGGCVAADSLIRYLSNLRQVKLPFWGWKHVTINTPQVRDDDILQKMNLSYKLPTFPMAYPDIGFDETDRQNHTRVLGIADSYYRDFLFLGVMRYVFANGKYWYYYNKVYPESDKHLLEVWELDLKKEIESNQVIVVLAAGGSLTNFGWGFIEDAYRLYTNPKAFYAKQQAAYYLNTYKKQVRDNPVILDQAKDESLRRNVTVDSIVTEMARAMMKEGETK